MSLPRRLPKNPSTETGVNPIYFHRRKEQSSHIEIFLTVFFDFDIANSETVQLISQ